MSVIINILLSFGFPSSFHPASPVSPRPGSILVLWAPGASRRRSKMETTQSWLSYFNRNADRTLECEDDGYRLTPAERRALTTSVQAFQIGEASEGKSLRAS